ncbi:hypothetical protein J2800_003373 [Caulobacter rhizosphaerae]|jgi:hypothetical protein|uniref:Uncharacterized protein n=1 Tax=Caulobacter rhizosphaerae TaxID=2010972 RepID=A0ABU1N2D5_9CAUL|nr:hypothetical protein [Caulobacter rhizosphaerae]MDR6532615.1 hypothetical protein [Caulobacter rhizosphaerae]
MIFAHSGHAVFEASKSTRHPGASSIHQPGRTARAPTACSVENQGLSETTKFSQPPRKSAAATASIEIRRIDQPLAQLREHHTDITLM